MAVSISRPQGASRLLAALVIVAGIPACQDDQDFLTKAPSRAHRTVVSEPTKFVGVNVHDGSGTDGPMDDLGLAYARVAVRLYKGVDASLGVDSSLVDAGFAFGYFTHGQT